MIRKRWPLFLSVGLVLFDQLLHTIWGYMQAHVINPNPQRWFGLIPGVTSYILALVGLGVLYKLMKPKTRRGKLGFALAFAGAASNLVTHVRYDHVVDYVLFGPWVINLADLMVTAGVLLILFSFVVVTHKSDHTT
jgi:lipoprotein signal peptidase